MFVTTVKNSDPVEYRLHRDTCKGLNGSQRPLEDYLAEDPKAVVDAKPCGQCSPSKAVQVSVRHQAETALAAVTAKTTRKTTKKEKNVSDTATETTPKAPRTLAPTEGTQTCEHCGQDLPLTSFPTRAAKPGEAPTRGKVCRADLAAARDAKKAEKATAVAE